MRFPMSSPDQILGVLPSTSYPPASPSAGGHLDELLNATVALLLRTVSNLGLPEEDEGGDAFATPPARSTGRIAADAARLTAAVAQLVRAHHLHSAPTTQSTTSQANAALVALLTELDAEADAEKERTRP